MFLVFAFFPIFVSFPLGMQCLCPLGPVARGFGEDSPSEAKKDTDLPERGKEVISD